MSQIIIRESSDFNETSSDNELAEQKMFKDLDKHAKKMLMSKSPSDQRFINIYRVR